MLVRIQIPIQKYLTQTTNNKIKKIYNSIFLSHKSTVYYSQLNFECKIGAIIE